MKIAIIGGSGKMGLWCARFLKREGYKITVTGRNKEKLDKVHQELGVATTTDNIEAVQNADVVILSVSMDNFEAVVREIGPYTHAEQIIADLTSVKTVPVSQMHRHIKEGIIIGGHPVFGPGAKDINSRSFILTPTTETEDDLALKIKHYLEGKGACVNIMTPEEHDEMMSVILGFAHFIAILSADTMSNFDRLQQMGEIGGITFKLLLTLAQSVISEDPDFYASLQMNLPGMADLEQKFQRRAKVWADMVENKDRDAFANEMRRLKNRFQRLNPDFNSSYEDMYKFIEVTQKPEREI